MPLVKNGRSRPIYSSMSPMARNCPVTATILVPAERFLADADAMLRAPGKTGVIWPNNRAVDDLVPYLVVLSGRAGVPELP